MAYEQEKLEGIKLGIVKFLESIPAENFLGITLASEEDAEETQDDFGRKSFQFNGQINKILTIKLRGVQNDR